jgi:proteasome accessory factor B
MSESKTERLLQLVLCLASAQHPVVKDRLRAAIPDYAACPTVEAFERMFERDKNELREMGVPLETAELGPGSDEPGYRIEPAAYALPELHLTAPELTAVAVAARVWREEGQAEAAARALRKLEADGVDVDPDALPAVQPRMSGGEAAFGPLTAAVAARRPVRFGYRSPGSAETAERHLEPWGVVSQQGRWYVVGFDRDRQDERVFRLSRIVGAVETDGPDGAYPVPADVDPRERVTATDPVQIRGRAQVLVRPDAGYGLRRQAESATSAADPATGYDRLQIGFTDLERLAEDIASYGSAVVVEEPAELRDAVIERLRAVAGGAA